MNLELDGLDLIEELRLRGWARLNYVPLGDRSPKWHPVILNEMSLRDHEEEQQADVGFGPSAIVPLEEGRTLRIDGAHPLQGPSRGHGVQDPAEFFYA